MNIFSISERRFRILMLSISFVTFLFLYHHAGDASFWLDELYSLSSIRSSLSFADTVKIYATEDNASPLFFFISYFWYRIVPHTEQALRAISILMVLSGCMVVGIIGKNLYGTRFGLLSFLFVLSNPNVHLKASLEFRVYSLLILCASLNIYFYLMRLKKESWNNILLYGVTMSLLPYTHYVSVIFCFGMFFADCVLIMRKRTSLRVIVSYLVGALLFLPWGLAVLRYQVNKFSYFWPDVPSLRSIINAGKYITGYNSMLNVMFWIALAGFVSVVLEVYRNLTDKRVFPDRMVFMTTGLFVSAFMVFSIYFYSAFINPGGSFFVLYYFFPLVPFAALIMAQGALTVHSILKPALAEKRMKLLCLLMFAMVIFSSIRSGIKQTSNPYREVSILLHELEREYTGKSAILTTDRRYAYYGWEELYLTYDHSCEFLPALCLRSDGESDENNVLPELKEKRYDRIYFCFFSNKISRIQTKKHYRVKAETSAVFDWLHENYDFGEVNEKYDMQILELRK